MTEIISELSNQLWGWPLITLLLGTHLFLTIRLRFPQRHVFRGIRLSIIADNGAKGDVSQFGALATSLAATIGTGNIVGVATAVALGGPGAIFWCWLTGFLGIATKYSEALLAVKYRVCSQDGRMLGGPMYTIANGLSWKPMAWIFALFAALTAFGIGNMVQSNAITTLCYQTYGVSPYITSVAVFVFSAMVILGGVRCIARVCTALVPLMALLYVLGCLYILYINANYLLPALRLILTSAFSPSAAGGGFMGITIMMTARYGIARGLFSNESGMGSAPIVAAAAQTNNPVRQALVSSTGTFWDTVVICAITGLVLVTSVMAYPDISWENGAVLTQLAFQKIPYIGAPLLTFGIITFAFSTILGWSYYGERGFEYIAGCKYILIYRFIYIMFIVVGGLIQLDTVWNIGDLLNGLMAIPNLISLLALSGVIVRETKMYINHG